MQGQELIKSARSFATQRAYKRALDEFSRFCADCDLTVDPGDPGPVIAWLTWCWRERRLKPASIRQRLAAVRGHFDARHGHEHAGRAPEIGLLLEGIEREAQHAERRAAPLTRALLEDLAGRKPRTLAGVRDKALLLVGYAAALRRSELVGLDAAHIVFEPRGAWLTLPRSKTNQRGRPEGVGIRYAARPGLCPVRWLRRWLDRADIEGGAVWRTVDRHGRLRETRMWGGLVGEVVKAYAESIGEDPAAFSGHSLRAGFVTDRIAEGVDSALIRRQTRHRDVRILARYDRAGRIGEWPDAGL